MKNPTLSLKHLALVVASALSLGACNRAEYAPLSQSATSPASLPVASQATPYVPIAAEESAIIRADVAVGAPAALAPVQAQSASAVVAAAPASAATPAAPMATTPAVKSAPAPKLNLVQRLAVRKIMKKLDKMASQAPRLKQRDASAARGGLDGNLRSALLFGLVGLILLLFSGVSSIFGILGTIFLIVGLVFLVLWVLDQA